MTKHLIAVIAVLALVAAACGGGSDDSGIASLGGDDLVSALDETGPVTGGAASDSAADEAVDPEEAMLAFAECMREQGIDMPDPTVDEDGRLRIRVTGPGEQGTGEDPGAVEFDREAMRAARDACSQYLEGVAQQFDRIDPTELQDQMLEYAACMRENGFDMPDPDLSAFPGGGGDGGVTARGPFGGAIDPDDPAFQAANEVCRELFTGGFGPGGGFGGGPMVGSRG